MAFGTNEEQIILLSIVIPTWNRSSSLDAALRHLLPQLESYSREIEIIISDNGSTDDTQNALKKVNSACPNLNIRLNRNKENLGFYGNLKICRELSIGKYLWVLSDDDYVCAGVINDIMRNIFKADTFAVIFLKNNPLKNNFKSYVLDRDELLIQEVYKIGLISSVIFLNKKEFDDHIYSEYNNSAFLGFLFLLNSFNFNRRVIIIEGNCLMGSQAKPKGYNFFDIFINHMEHVITYMHFLRIPGKIIKKFRQLYLTNFIARYYILLKGEKKLKFGEFQTLEISSVKEIEKWIRRSYSDMLCYWSNFYPLTLIPGYIFASALKIRKMIIKKSN